MVQYLNDHLPRSFRNPIRWDREGHQHRSSASGARGRSYLREPHHHTWYPGQLVLRDLDLFGNDGRAAHLILARFALLQFVLLEWEASLPDQFASEIALRSAYLEPEDHFDPAELSALTDAYEALLALGQERAREGDHSLPKDEFQEPPKRKLARALLMIGVAAERAGHTNSAQAFNEVGSALSRLPPRHLPRQV